MNTLKKTLSRFLILLGILFLVIVISLTVSVASMREQIKIPDRAVLTIDLRNIEAEHTLASPLVASIFGNSTTVFDVVTLLRTARDDSRVRAIVIKTPAASLSYSQIRDLREAVIDFRSSGKKVHAFTDTFAEIGNGIRPYYLASACDTITMQPSGMLGLNGLSSTSMFLRGTFDKIGVEPQGGKRKEYKTYWNMFTETEYTDAHREAVTEMLDSLLSTIITDISADRDIPEEKLRAIMSQPPLDAKSARESGLTDTTGYGHDLIEKIKTEAGAEELTSFASYKTDASTGAENMMEDTVPQVAFVYAEGPIYRGSSEYSATGEMNSIGADTLVRALQDAADDEEIDGIIFRVNSPGGSAVASETIWHAVRSISDADKKPLIVSMSSVAASGGYYISMGAPEIIAQPLTLTGSIGVVYGKLYMRDMWKKLGISFDSAKNGQFADLFSPLKRFSEEQRVFVDKQLDTTYNIFVSRVAAGRELSSEAAEAAAKGRVWTGKTAVEKGLVDTTGGMRTAFTRMKEKLGLSDDDTIIVTSLPEPPDLREVLLGGGGSGITISHNSSLKSLQLLAPFLDRISEIGPLLSTGPAAVSDAPEIH